MSHGEARDAAALPEAVGAPISREELGRAVDCVVRAIAADLQMDRMVALSYDAGHRRLRVVNTVGFPLEAVRTAVCMPDDCPAVGDALQTGTVVVDVEPALALPAAAARHFSGPVAVVPLLLGERRVAVLCGSLRAGVSVHSLEWQRAARAAQERGALVAECQRLQAALLDVQQAQERGRAVAAAIVEQRPLTHTLSLIADEAADRFHVDRVGIYLFDETGLHAAHLRSVPPEYAEAVQRHAADNPIIRESAIGGKVHVVEDAATDAGYAAVRETVVRSGVGCIAAVPVHYGQSVRGALCLYPRSPRRFTPADLGALRLMGDQAALAVAVSTLLLQRAESGALLERERLAREIHDTVAQALTGIVLQLEGLERLMDDPAEARQVLAEARSLAREALEETRRAVMGLTPTPLERLDLPRALERELRVFEHQTHLRTAFVATGEAIDLADDLKAGAFRIVQEALNNVRKHAQAARVRVSLTHLADGVRVVVEDDGTGFDTAASAAPGAAGYGIFGMQERARLLGGEVTVESTPGWGTRVSVSLPHAEAGEGAAESLPPGAGVSVHSGRASAEPAAADGPIRVVMADDHAVTRQGIRRIIEQTPGMVVVGEAEDGLQALELVRKLHPHVVLLDVKMPRMDGVQVLRHLQADPVAPPAIVLTHSASEEVLLECIRAGARAYLLKDAAPGELAAAVRAVYGGESLVDPAMTGSILERLREPEPAAPGGPELNPREREVLELLATGARNRDIARRLYLSEKTVEFHLSNLFAKLDVANRTEAARYAIEHGLTGRAPAAD